jgi:hypothetical protein
VEAERDNLLVMDEIYNEFVDKETAKLDEATLLREGT